MLNKVSLQTVLNSLVLELTEIFKQQIELKLLSIIKVVELLLDILV